MFNRDCFRNACLCECILRCVQQLDISGVDFSWLEFNPGRGHNALAGAV
jgi:hypothetical protein